MAAKGKKPLGARDMALRVLLRVEGGEDAQAALHRILDAHAAQAAPDPRDAGLCTELVYGSLRYEVRVQHVLQRFASKPHKLPAEVRRTVLLALHELLFLPQQAQHAVVHWAVERTRQGFGKALCGAVNGILRTVQRRLDEVRGREFYSAELSPLQAEAVFYATPAWLAELWDACYGREACVALMQRALAQPWPCVRVNVLHAEGPALRENLLAQGGEAVGRAGVAFGPGALPDQALGHSLRQWHESGALSWQAAGSLTVLELLQEACGAALGQRPLWDACAGQGGKALALMEQGIALGLCSDMHRGRLRLLRTACARLGLGCPPLARMSAAQPCLRQWDGHILLDVPCSGLGTLARRPEIRWRRKPEDMEALTALQAHMLQRAWDLLTPGALLVYMTCTLNPAENEGQVRALLKAQSNARLELEWQTEHEHPWLEGMYVALLHKM